MLRTLPLAVIAAAALASTTALSAERAGETTRVQPSSYQKTGVYPFDLHRGDEIYREAQVFTRANGSVAMLFDDGTDLVLGPNTEIMIDEYVYAPGGASRAAISFGKGLLRMVSGRMPDGSISIATPVATVGIRGTSFALLLGTSELKGWVEDGTVTVTPVDSGQSYDFTAPSTFACTSVTCEEVPGAPPPPSAFPTPGSGSGFGFGGSDRGGADGSHGHDHGGGGTGGSGTGGSGTGGSGTGGSGTGNF